MNHGDRDIDSQVRFAAFRFLENHALLHGDVFSRETLERGFEFQRERIILVGPQGIFKPRILPYFPISILTVAPKASEPRPYEDGFRSDGTLIYRYRGVDPEFHENVRLRRAMAEGIPLIYFHAISPGRYLAAWPAFIVGDDPAGLSFVVDVDSKSIRQPLMDRIADAPLSRSYLVQPTRRRVHQEMFRERVLRAYREQCAVCRLRHTELLDAAHIIPDANPLGEPVVSNGISLCKLHHAAFDASLFAIRPDFVVEVQRRVLEETDGPMLRYGLQEIHQSPIELPRLRELRPSAEALDYRYSIFKAAAAG